MTTTHLSLEKYLRTDYEPDCDYVDGKLEERNTGEFEHSAVLGFLVSATSSEECGFEGYPVIRIRVSPTRVRVADIAILSS